MASFIIIPLREDLFFHNDCTSCVSDAEIAAKDFKSIFLGYCVLTECIIVRVGEYNFNLAAYCGWKLADTVVICHVQSSLMKGSNDDSFSSCGRSDGSDIGSVVSSLVSACCMSHYSHCW